MIVDVQAPIKRKLRIVFSPFRGGFYSHTSYKGPGHKIDRDELDSLIRFGALPEMNVRQKELFLQTQNELS